MKRQYKYIKRRVFKNWMTEEKAFMFGNNTAVLEERNLQSTPGRELDFRG